MSIRFKSLYHMTALLTTAALVTACNGGYDPPATTQGDMPQPAAPQPQSPEMVSPDMAPPQQETDLAQMRIPGPVTIVDQPLGDVLRLLHEHTGIQFMMGVDGLRPVTLSLTDPTIVEVLEALREEANIGFEMREGAEGPVIAVMDAEDIPAAEAPLAQPGAAPPAPEGEVALQQIPPLQTVIQGPISVQDQPIGYVLQSLQAQSGVQFLPGDAADMNVTLSLENPSILDIVEAIVETHDVEAQAVQQGGQYIVHFSRTE